MDKNGVFRLRFCILSLYVCVAAICLMACDATLPIHRFRVRKYFKYSNTKTPSKIHTLRNLDIDMPLDSSNTDPYISSPFSLPPYESLPPFGLPVNAPPYCINPPSTPLPPSTNPSPIGGYTPSPPPASARPTFPGPSPSTPNPPTIVPSPPFPGPSSSTPNPPTTVPSPPSNVPTPTQPRLSPPYYEPTPPSGYPPSPLGPPFNIPSPSRSIPSPRFLPPIVYPPPTVPPPPHRAPVTAMWCVAKPAVPEPIIQEAMNYACGSGADCDQIQSSGPCFEPNTIIAHASYAFNSYWQRTKVAGGNCDFGGTALLVTVDPSFDGCHFIYF